MALAAEYGFYYRMPDDEAWQTMAPEVDTSWRDIVRPILEVGGWVVGRSVRMEALALAVIMATPPQCLRRRTSDPTTATATVIHAQYFTERTPGTYIEKKESSLTWHYRDADPNFGSWQVGTRIGCRDWCSVWLIGVLSCLFHRWTLGASSPTHRSHMHKHTHTYTHTHIYIYPLSITRRRTCRSSWRTCCRTSRSRSSRATAWSRYAHMHKTHGRMVD
jgi:hypothetical protein